MKTKVLLLEDEIDLGETLKDFLDHKGFECHWYTHIKNATNAINDHSFHLALLDINVPDGNGIELARMLRKNSPRTLLFFLTAQNDPELRLESFELGAQDFITKPFQLKELIIRLNRIRKLQAYIADGPQKIQIGDIVFYPQKFELFILPNSKKILLSQKEAAIFHLLISNKEKVISRDEIIDHVWGEESYPSARTVDNYIVTLRKWIQNKPNDLRILSVRGIGYKLEIKNEVQYE